jgi:hypothetical protein
MMKGGSSARATWNTPSWSASAPSWSVSAPNRRIESLVGKRGASANISFVCVSGTNERAYEIAKAFDVEMRGLAGARLVVSKAYNVIVCSHGMGGPSVSICMNELTGHRRGQQPAELVARRESTERDAPRHRQLDEEVLFAVCLFAVGLLAECSAPLPCVVCICLLGLEQLAGHVVVAEARHVHLNAARSGR